MYASRQYGSPVTRSPSPAPPSPQPALLSSSSSSSELLFWRRSLSILPRRERSFVRHEPYTTLHSSRREEVLVWVIECCSELSLSQAVVSVTRNILDRFISSCTHINAMNLAVVASAALFIATKVTEDIYPNNLLSILANLSGTTTGLILRYETIILAAIDWRVNIVTPHEVTKELLHHLPIHIPEINYVMCTIESLLLASELEYALIDTFPSTISTAATIIAFDTANQPTLALHTAMLARDNGVDMEAVKHTVQLLQDSLRKINNSHNINNNNPASQQSSNTDMKQHSGDNHNHSNQMEHGNPIDTIELIEDDDGVL